MIAVICQLPDGKLWWFCVDSWEDMPRLKRILRDDSMPVIAVVRWK